MKKIIQISFSVWIAILIFGCEAEKFSPTPDEKEISISTKKSAAVPSYDYFDFIGKVHNEAVKLALASSTYPGLSDNGKQSFFVTKSQGLYPNYGITPVNQQPSNIAPIVAAWKSMTVQQGYTYALNQLTTSERQIITTMATINDETDLTVRASKSNQLKMKVFNSTTFTDAQKVFLLCSISLIYESKHFWEQNPGASAIGGGVWKADWKGFWYGWSMNTSYGTFSEHWENATGTAELASEMQRHESQ